MKKLEIFGKLSLTKFFLMSKNNEISVLKINCRNFLITQLYVNNLIKIYNGKIYIPLYIKKNFIGYKIGTFIKTKKFNNCIKDKKIK